ncbi:PulJ/GspJ family protein [Planomonospora venezuelensis]|uniref:Type II secretory pathway pseudopilin PulG n=1 Tax=Planomonospora venezuelensis TaxID=1999 RepID=A0A841D9R6_PLAVE|nr:hypothetical protein [Planomonospora venezuelensis]MBB5966720.1 type II secretory pathway pseudopilin PulG [Planomonospora venezuelensis]GIN00309.1 hypothetical protein Pve01_19670 [Planomonospora venezuelensis]
MGGRRSRLARRLRDVRASGDAGISLIEILVTIGVMGVVMTMFTTGVLQVYRTVNTVESLSTAQSQLHVAYQRLDREIRYASWLSAVRGDGDHWYVGFAYMDFPDEDAQTPQPVNAQTRQPWCGRLRLDLGTGVLQLQRWTPGSPPAAGTPGETLASHVVTDGGLRTDPPFSVRDAGSSATADAAFVPDFQQLRVNLAVRVGSGQHAATTDFDVTFTALNTSRETEADNACDEGSP